VYEEPLVVDQPVVGQPAVYDDGRRRVVYEERRDLI
jgi:hypothetical protein